MFKQQRRTIRQVIRNRRCGTRRGSSPCSSNSLRSAPIAGTSPPSRPPATTTAAGSPSPGPFPRQFLDRRDTRNTLPRCPIPHPLHSLSRSGTDHRCFARDARFAIRDSESRSPTPSLPTLLAAATLLSSLAVKAFHAISKRIWNTIETTSCVTWIRCDSTIVETACSMYERRT